MEFNSGLKGLIEIIYSQLLHNHIREPWPWAQTVSRRALTAINRDRLPSVHVGSVGDGTDL